MSGAVHPWQEAAWNRLVQARRADRMPHALLVSGPAGTGVRRFAEALGQWQLCSQPEAVTACGGCRGCTLYAAGTHPDAVRLEPAEPGKAIPIDAVRDLSARLTLTAGQTTKVALIDPADAMTTAAANSLLKTLEEPAGGSRLILVSRRTARLPATVRSRCQRVSFGLPDTEAAAQWLAGQGVEDAGTWLARAGGAPLTALELSNSDKGRATDRAAQALLEALETGRVPVGGMDPGVALADAVAALAATIEDLLRLRRAPVGARLRRPDFRDRMAELAPRLDEPSLFHYLDSLYRAMPGASSSLRTDIQFQGLLADAARVGAAGGPRPAKG